MRLSNNEVYFDITYEVTKTPSIVQKLGFQRIVLTLMCDLKIYLIIF